MFDVHVVEDDELPDGVQRVMVERPAGEAPLLVVAASAAGTCLFVRAWQETHQPPEFVPVLRAV